MPPRKKTRETLVNEPGETPTAVDGPQEAAVAAPKETPASAPKETTAVAVADDVAAERPHKDAPPAFADDGKQWPPPGCHCAAGIIHKNHPGRMPEPEKSV